MRDIIRDRNECGLREDKTDSGGELRDLETMSIEVTARNMGILVMAGRAPPMGAADKVDRLV